MDFSLGAVLGHSGHTCALGLLRLWVVLQPSALVGDQQREGKMRSMKTVLLGFTLAVVLGGIAWSQGDQPGQQLSGFQLRTGTVLFVTPDGTVSRHSDVP